MSPRRTLMDMTRALVILLVLARMRALRRPRGGTLPPQPKPWQRPAALLVDEPRYVYVAEHDYPIRMD